MRDSGSLRDRIPTEGFRGKALVRSLPKPEPFE